MSRYTGATTEIALNQALLALNAKKEDVLITVIEEGKKGFLGMGKKDAVIEVTLKSKETAEIAPEKKESLEIHETKKAEDHKDVPIVETTTSLKNSDDMTQPVLENLEDEEALKELGIYLTAISSQLDVPALVRMERTKEVIIFHLETSKQGMLIGKHGKILNALQYLAQVFVHRVAKNKLSVVVNVGDYREKRQGIVESLAKRTAKKVQETKQPVFLEPMPAFERKIIHSILSENPYITTHSEGEEPYRYLVVEPSNKQVL